MSMYDAVLKDPVSKLVTEATPNYMKKKEARLPVRHPLEDPGPKTEIPPSRYCPKKGCGKRWVWVDATLEKTGNKMRVIAPDGPECKAHWAEYLEEQEKVKGVAGNYEHLLRISGLPGRCKTKTFIIPNEDPPEIWKKPNGMEFTIPNDKGIKIEKGDVVVQMLEYSRMLEIAVKPEMYFGQKPLIKGIFVPGTWGTGKTSMVCEIAKQAMRRGKCVRYVQAAELITQKTNVWDLVGVDFLFLDDVGNDKIESKDNLIWSMFNRRMDAEGLFTAVVTNFPDKHVEAIYGGSFMDRLKLLEPIAMIGASKREIEKNKS